MADTVIDAYLRGEPVNMSQRDRYRAYRMAPKGTRQAAKIKRANECAMALADAVQKGVGIDILADTRECDVVWWRQVAMAVMRAQRHPLPLIAKALNRTDRTTVIHGVAVVADDAEMQDMAKRLASAVAGNSVDLTREVDRHRTVVAKEIEKRRATQIESANKMKARNDDMALRAIAGETYAAIGRRYGITTARVQQICVSVLGCRQKQNALTADEVSEIRKLAGARLSFAEISRQTGRAVSTIRSACQRHKVSIPGKDLTSAKRYTRAQYDGCNPACCSR